MAFFDFNRLISTAYAYGQNMTRFVVSFFSTADEDEFKETFDDEVNQLHHFKPIKDGESSYKKGITKAAYEQALEITNLYNYLKGGKFEKDKDTPNVGQIARAYETITEYENQPKLQLMDQSGSPVDFEKDHQNPSPVARPVSRSQHSPGTY